MRILALFRKYKRSGRAGFGLLNGSERTELISVSWILPEAALRSLFHFYCGKTVEKKMQKRARFLRNDETRAGAVRYAGQGWPRPGPGRNNSPCLIVATSFCRTGGKPRTQTILFQAPRVGNVAAVLMVATHPRPARKSPSLRCVTVAVSCPRLRQRFCT